MSVSEKMDHGFDAGFTRSWDRTSARRQFQMSMILVAALVCSAAVLASTLRVHQPLQEGRSTVISRTVDKSAAIVVPFAGALAPVR